MPLTPDQREAVQKALKDTGIKVEYLILGPDERTPVRTDTAGYLDWCLDKSEDRVSAQIALEEIGNVRISTVFIAATIINGNEWMAKRPFETMVFEEGRNLGMTRKYATFEEAEVGHAEVIAEVLALSISKRPGR
ncbi:hypothetical protein [Rhizobium sp. MHM7A]|uniref:hypothetical protein n=1 Tax=Rhizobium sp. MHM7A TaxID=2583233 RepID=UPI0011063A26|nr:hypothetical protein [Rhizobium sp. MHM7A]TLX17135.1 hypothetical protein FFR93_07440 [Rhizobium sp. MHM7A]